VAAGVTNRLSNSARVGRRESGCGCHFSDDISASGTLHPEAASGSRQRGMVSIQQPEHGVVPRGLSAALSALLLQLPHDGYLAKLCGAAHRVGERMERV